MELIFLEYYLHSYVIVMSTNWNVYYIHNYYYYLMYSQTVLVIPLTTFTSEIYIWLHLHTYYL